MKKKHSVALSALVLTLAFFSYPSTGNALMASKQMLDNRLVDIGGGGGGGGTTVAIDKVTTIGGGGTTTYVPIQNEVALCKFYSQSTCQSSCNGVCLKNTNGCWNCAAVVDFSDKEPIEVPNTAVSETVSVCPSGTTKSSDGCCCVNN